MGYQTRSRNKIREKEIGGADMKKVKRKSLFIVLGCVGLALGAVGAVLPLMPAFPFCCWQLLLC